MKAFINFVKKSLIRKEIRDKKKVLRKVKALLL